MVNTHNSEIPHIYLYFHQQVCTEGQTMCVGAKVRRMCGLAASRGAVLCKYESNIIRLISHGRTVSNYASSVPRTIHQPQLHA